MLCEATSKLWLTYLTLKQKRTLSQLYMYQASVFLFFFAMDSRNITCVRKSPTDTEKAEHTVAYEYGRLLHSQSPDYTHVRTITPHSI